MTLDPGDPPPPPQRYHLRKGEVPRSQDLALLLALLLALQAVGLTCFTFGFFLTRFEVPHSSQCQDATAWAVDERRRGGRQGINETSVLGSSGCWYEARYPRAVLVVIDALRLDFAEHYTEEEVALFDRQHPRAHYHLNQIPVIAELLESHPSQSILYRFEADPPTTTMQRLKGMTTGSLPTFIDFRQNFQSSAILEDNLIRQLKSQGKRLTVMGDDTWSLLFPEAFDRSFPYPSFNTRDIDTVDNGVLAHLQPELAGGEWDVLVAHFLGVDHVGHTYGPDHLAMQTKLRQMDTVLRQVLDTIQVKVMRLYDVKLPFWYTDDVSQDDTLLLVMGDHGMTEDGNHGGASQQETGAALFVHSRAVDSLLVPGPDPGSVHLWSSSSSSEGPMQPHVRPSPSPVVAQVDLVPSLALLLGVPIPYANLGGIIPELFYTPTRGYQGLAHALHLNARQVSRYLDSYASIARMPQEDLDHLHRIYQDAQAKYEQAHQSSQGGQEEQRQRRLLGEVCVCYRHYLRQALELGRRVWTQYDEVMMGCGLAVLLVSLVAALVIHRRPPSLPQLLLATLPAGVLSPLSWLLLPSHIQSDPLRGLLIVITIFLCTTCLTLTLPLRLGPTPPRSPPWSWRTYLNVLVISLHAASLFSNSFIEGEHHVYLFLSSTVITLNLLLPPSSNGRDWVWLAVAALGRVAFAQKGHGQDVLSHLTLHGTFLPLGGLAWLHARLVPAWSQRVSLCLAYGAMAVYWLSHAEEGGPWVWAHSMIRLGVPRVIYVLAPIASLVSVRPSTTRGHQEKGKVREAGVRAEGGRSTDPQPWCGHPCGCPQWRRPPWETGLTTSIFWGTAPLMLVLGPASPLTLLCLAGQSLLLAQSTPLRPCPPHSTSATPLDLAILFTLIGRGYFFATGHHNQFNRLQYSAAFVGFDDFNVYIGGALLALNTLGIHGLWALVVALLCLSTTQGGGGERGGLPLLAAVSFWMTMISTLGTIMTALCVAIQRRHLMVWAIFAPKFIFDSVLHVVTTTASLLAFLIACRYDAGYSLSPTTRALGSHDGLRGKEA